MVLLDPQGREALRLPHVLAALSPRSLWNLGFEQVLIENPQLDVRRAADGRLFVAGLDLSRAGDNDGRAADWFFRQGEFVIRGGTLRWTDELRGAPALALSHLDFVARNKLRRHAVRLDATPPAEWGHRFSLAGEFREPLLSGGGGRWQDWAGQLYAEFSHVDISELRRYADLGVRVGERVVVRPAAQVLLQRAAAAIGLHIGKQAANRALSRWVPVVGAAGVGAYAWWDTRQVGRAALQLFEREQVIDNPVQAGPAA